MTPCPGEQLEAFALDELAAEESAVLRAHVQRCKACAHEVAWLRTERRLVRERGQALPPPPLKMLELRRAATQRLTRSSSASGWDALRERLWSAGRVAASGLAVVAVAFVLSGLPSQQRGMSVVDMGGSSCVSVDVASGGVVSTGLCSVPNEHLERVAAVENAFEACLVATPLGSSGSEICW